MARDPVAEQYSAHTDFAIQAERQRFLAQPPQARAETLERVRQTLAAERKRGQISPSWLMRHAREIYGELL